MVQDGVIAFLSAAGLASVVWLLGGAFLRWGRAAIPGVRLVLPLRGDAPAMESDLRELRRLRHQLPGSRIVLEDRGLSREARALAEYLSEREEHIELTDGVWRNTKE